MYDFLKCFNTSSYLNPLLKILISRRPRTGGDPLWFIVQTGVCSRVVLVPLDGAAQLDILDSAILHTESFTAGT